MRTLFEKNTLKGMELANRFVRSATWEGMAADDGAVTPRLIDTMTVLARGGVGLIISGHAYVRPDGQAGPWQLGIHKDSLIDGLREMTTAVHGAGGKIVAQLAHAGNFAAKQLSGELPWVVSDYDGLAKSPRREMSADDIQTLVGAYGDAARRARDAGFDGVQIHSAHGYLLSQFLSPVFNRRSDEYGGDIANRARVHVAICTAIRQAVGPDYPVLIKINGQDYVENGLVREDTRDAIQMLAAAGLDAVEISGGVLTGGKLSPSRAGINRPEKEAYFREDARAIRQAVDLPIILVGGMRSVAVAEDLVTEGLADYIAMSRPLIREPDLIKRWQSGDRRPAECKSDNLCFGPAMEGKGIYCLTEEREKAR